MIWKENRRKDFYFIVFMISKASNEIMKTFIEHLAETIFRSFHYLIHRYRHLNSYNVRVPPRLRLLRCLSSRSFDKFLLPTASSSTYRFHLIMVREGTTTSWTHSPSVRLFACFLGIFVAYLLFGIVQESIVKGKYGKNDKFTFIISLVFFQCIFNAIVSKIILVVRKSQPDTTPSKMYACASFTYLFAMLASNYALEFVSYPMQVLGKSVKPVPVMLLGVLVARKRYPWIKYFYVMLIVLGVVLFMYKKPKPTAKGSDSTAFIGIGEFLLFVSLVFDGLTGGIQDKIRDKHQVQAYHMMYSMNIWSCLWALIGISITGEFYGLGSFLQVYPNVILKMFLLGLMGAIGQNFIFLTIEWFGPLTCSIFTTTRKFFTILCSVIIFRNPISSQQIFGTVLVFLGLFLEQFFGKKTHHS